MIISLVALYKFLPNRKIFYYFCASLVIVFAIAGLIARTQQPKESMDEAQRYAILQQQKIFTGWYTNYQKDIDQLDRNWKLFFTIIENFNSDNIDVETLHERLINLENESKIEQVHIYTLKTPPDMGEECNLLIEEMLKKYEEQIIDLQNRLATMSNKASSEEYAAVMARLKDLQDLYNKETARETSVAKAEQEAVLREKQIAIKEIKEQYI